MDKLRGYFANRQDALDQLIGEIENVDMSNTLILSISKDGSILAKGMADHFNVPFEYLFLSDIKAPENPDCVIALVSEKMDVVVDEHLIQSFGISIDDVYLQARKQYEQIIVPQAKRIRGEREMQSFLKKNILIVDEGVETGFSIELAIKACVNGGCKSASIAIPVLSQDVEGYLLQKCDCIYRILSPEYFVSTNYYYKDLPTLDDEMFLSSRRYFF